MVTATRPPIEAPAAPAESQLQEYHWLIHDACFRLCRKDGNGLALEDLVQEATVAVWEALQDHPSPNHSFIYTVAYHGAIRALRRNRRSVDRPFGSTGYQVVSLETLTVDTPSGEPLEIEDAIARHRRRGEISDPTQDIAVAHLMQEELGPLLTPRERLAFALLLLEYRAQEIAYVLGVSEGYAQRLVMRVRIKAAGLWDLPETRVDPSLSFRRCYERNKDKYNANRRAKRQANPEEYNARRREKKREKRGLGRQAERQALGIIAGAVKLRSTETKIERALPESR